MAALCYTHQAVIDGCLRRRYHSSHMQQCNNTPPKPSLRPSPAGNRPCALLEFPPPDGKDQGLPVVDTGAREESHLFLCGKV